MNFKSTKQGKKRILLTTIVPSTLSSNNLFFIYSPTTINDSTEFSNVARLLDPERLLGFGGRLTEEVEDVEEEWDVNPGGGVEGSGLDRSKVTSSFLLVDWSGRDSAVDRKDD